MMKVKYSQFMIAMLALSLAAVSGFAQTSQPSSKVTAKTSALNLIDPGADGQGVTGLAWTTLLSNTIKTANQKDLFINASFEVGLYTDTLVSSRNMTKDTSTADAAVRVRVLLDGDAVKPVEPGPVVYGRRIQTLSATLEGAIAGCLTISPTGTIVLNEDCVDPEIIQLILQTLDAASFNFVAVDVPQGVHTIEVQAQIITATKVDTGSAVAKALVGKGAMTVESVRLIKDPDVILDL
jgi:hypothetical protein